MSGKLKAFAKDGRGLMGLSAGVPALCVALVGFVALAGEVDSDFWVRSFPEPPSTSTLEFGRAFAQPEKYVAQWTARPATDECDLSAGVVVQDGYGLTGDLQTVRTDLDRFLGDIGLATGAGKPLVLRRERVSDHESYRLDVTAEGVTLVADDDDGIRRGVYFFENRLLESAAPALKIGSTVRRSWMKTRFSRSFFAPINRSPHYNDELMDDVDYYPDALLDRLAHEGVNAIWLTQRLRDVASTSFTVRDPNADRRVRKLREVARKLRRYGIGLWVFGIEPAAIRRGDRHYDTRTDPLLRDHPEWFRKDPYEDFYVMCPCEPGARQFLGELMADLFRRVPELAGYLNISHGERQTTCFSRICASPHGEMGGEPMSVVRGFCPTCAAHEPWQLHELFTKALVDGMRRAKPSARLVSWFYMPYRVPDRHDWVFEVPRHLPDGVTLMFNFESGMLERQLGKMREGGDYWLSHVGPSQAFSRMAVAGCRGVKLQVGNDYGLGTVPLVPAPALLYRKYSLLHGMGTDTVLQNWLIGGMPGLQNAAAGELAFEDFAAGEDAFLRRLAASVWGAAGAETAAKMLKAYSDAFSFYPLSMVTQYYSPLNEGVAWPLYPDVEMKPLMPSWKPHQPPCGDTVGEAFDNHTLEEALALVSRMGEVPDARLLPGATPQQRRERDLMRAVGLHFRSAGNDLAFYWHRRNAVSRSRDFGDAAGAVESVDAMAEIVRKETATAVEMKELSTRNPMLGYQSEAEFRRYFPAVFDWRTNELAWAGRRLATIRAALQRGEPYPESARERTAARCEVNGAETRVGDLRWRLTEANGVLRLCGTCRATGSGDCVDIAFMNATASEHPIAVTVTPEGPVPYRRGWAEVGCDLSMFACTATPAKDGEWSFSVEIRDWVWGRDPARRPAWLSLQAPRLGVSWPKTEKSPFGRLRLGPTGDGYGRVIWPARTLRREAERMVAEGLACGVALASNRQPPVAFGWQCRKSREVPMTVDSRFDLASVTKTFTAVLCARLAAQGKLDVDAPFTKYLPEHVLAKEPCDITVRDLAMHVGGFASERSYEHTKSLEECRRIAMSYRPIRKRLERFEYACLNYFYLGWIAEKVTGLPLDAAVKKYVFDPVGMPQTCWGPVKDDGHVVEIGVSPAGIGDISDFGAQSVAPHAVGNAGIFSTAGDMLLYAKTLLERKVFEPAAYDLLFTCAFDKDGERRSFGFDMSAEDRPEGLSDQTILHSGWSGQTIAIDPATGYCGVCLTGRSGGHGASRRARANLLSLMARWGMPDKKSR